MIKTDAETGQHLQLVDLGALWRTLRAGWRSIALCSAGALALAVIYLIITPPFYTAETLLVVDPARSGHADLRGALSDDASASGDARREDVLNDEIQIATSRRALEMTREALELDQHPMFNPEGASDPATRRKILEALAGSLALEQEASSRVIRLAATSEDPVLAADIANTVAESYINLDREDNIAASRQAEEWLRSRISDLEAQVEASQEALNTYRVEAGLIDDAGVQSLTEQLDRLRRTALEAQAARAAIEAAAEANGADVSADLNLARAREEVLQSSIEDTAARLATLTRAQGKMQRLQRQVETDQILYERFLEQMKEMTALSTFTTPRAQIIDRAEPPMDPAGPSTPLTVLSGLIGGALIGALVVLFRDSRRQEFLSRDELERDTGLPVVASLPAVADLAEAPDLAGQVSSAPDSEFSEALRGLRARVFRDKPADQALVVSLTSSRPHEGKSALALSLAHASAVAGSRVLLVDADLRKAQLTRYLGISGETDIEAVLMEGAQPDAAIYRNAAFGLDVMAAQLTGKSDPSTVNGQDVKWLITQLRAHYDLIVFDTPPITPVFDAGVISKHCDMVLMVVKFDETPRATLDEALRRLGALDVSVAGLVFNQVDVRREAGYRGVAYEDYTEYWTSPEAPNAQS